MKLSFWGLAITLAAYVLAALLHKRFPLAILQPILVAALLLLGFLAAFKVPREAYSLAVEPLTQLLLPATVCLAIPVYKQRQLLRRYLLPVLVGIGAGVLTAMGSVVLVVRLFGLDKVWLATLLPKSITSAFGMGLAAEYGGIPAMATLVIILTGIVGSVICGAVCKVFGITHPVAVGLGIGSAAHAVGTAKALAMGETQGAMSSLAMVLTGLMTTALMPLFLMLA